MSSKKQKFAKQIKQNKVDRINRTNEKYNTKMSKSDKAYIDGNYKKSVNLTTYGVKKNLAEGKTVNGYGSDYVDTKGMKRSRYLKKQKGENPYEAKYLYIGGKPKYVEGGTRADGSEYDGFYSRNRKLTKHEKESYKNTGTLNHKDYMPKESYKVFGSANKNAKNFKEHLNTGYLDGIKTAKKNQRTGKHIENAFEYIKGGAKDILLDPVVDLIKGADYIGGTTVAGIAGFAEDSGNVFKAIADPKRDLKYYSKGKSYTKENLKENFNSLNKTGSSQSLSKYLQDARKRGFEENYNILKEQGRHKEAKEYKKNYEKETPTATKALNVTGFVGELLSPSTVENAITKVGKGLAKNTVKSFKDMVKGTADLSTAIVPEETAKLMAKAQKYTGKANGSSDSVFYSGKKGTTSIDKKLDNQYAKTVENVKDAIKQNPKTKNIGKYLDVLENKKSYKGKQANIDGRTLNKKYTQTKDGYVPNKIEVIEDIKDVSKNNVKGQYSMFGKDGSMNAYIDNIQNPNARYEKVFNKYANNIDELVEKIDSMKPHNADAMYDYLRTNKPEIYEQIVKDSDNIDEVIYGSANLKGYKDEIKTKADKTYFGTKNVRDFSNIDKVDDVSKLNENYNKFNLDRVNSKMTRAKNYKLLKEVFDTKMVDEFKSLPSRKSAYKQGINTYLNNISKLDYNGLKQALNGLNEVSKLPKDTPTYVKADMLNKMLFNNYKVIRDNIPSNTLDNFVDFLEDNLNLNMANILGDKSFVRKNGEIFNIHDKNDILQNLPVNANMFTPALTDVLYEDKLKDIAKQLKVPGKNVLNDRKKELEALRKQRVLNTDEYYELKDIKDKINTWDKMYKEVGDMGEEYVEYAQKKFGKIDNNKGYNDALGELAEKQKEKDILDEIKYSKDANSLDAKRNREFGSVRHQQAQAGKVGEHSAPNLTTQELHKLKYDQKILNHKIDNIRKTYDLPKAKHMKIKLQKGQKLKDLPPVKENLQHLKKTIQKEIRYMFENPDKYNEFKDAFKQVKLDYVNSLRTIGVPDDKYFHKVTALQNELKGKMNEILKGGSENTPLLKMELQKLASRVDETFNSFDDVVLDKVDEYVDDFEKVIEKENIESSLKLREQIQNNSNKSKNRATINPITEQKLAKYEKQLNLPKPKTLDELEFNIPGVDEDGVISKLDKHTKPEKLDNKKPLYKDNEIYDGYKRWLNSYKKGLTVYNPGWHVQNYFQNKGQNFLALGLDAFKPQTDAKNVLKHINGEASKDKFILNSKTKKAYTTDEIANLAQEFGVVDGLGNDVKNAKGIFSRLENRIDNTPLMKWLDKNEQTARLHHFVKQIEKGMSPEDAAKSVNKYLFDYSKKNKVDDFIGDFIDPFWTFHKNNAKLMYQSAIEHGDKISKINRATKGLEEGIPGDKKQNEENKYGKIQLPYSTIKDSVNKDDYNFLYNQNVLPNFEDAFPLDRDSFENKLNPIVRLLLQQSRGEGNFGNKIVDVKEGEKPGWDEISKEDRIEEVISELNPFMPNLSKTINSHKKRKQKAEDGTQSKEMSDRQIFFDWINYITGGKGNYYRNTDF